MQNISFQIKQGIFLFDVLSKAIIIKNCMLNRKILLLLLIIQNIMTSEQVFSYIRNMLESYKVYFQEATKKQKIEQLLRSQTRPYKNFEAFVLQIIPQGKQNQFLKQFYKIIYPPVVNEYSSIQSKQVFLGKIQDVEIGVQSSKFSQMFNQKTETRVKSCLQACSSMQQFLEHQIYQIIDILRRKSPLIDYFNILKKQFSLGGSVFQAFKQITFVDFTILLMKFTQPSDIISILLAQQSAPMPITYSVRQKQINNAQEIIWLLGSTKYPLVIDIWTEEAANRLKVYKQNKWNPFPQKIYFSQMFSIATQYFEGCSFGSNINLFKLSLASNGGRQNMFLVSLISYQKQGDSSLSIKQSFIKSLIKSASFVIVHMDDQNFGQQNQTKIPSIFKKFNFLFEDGIQKLYIVQLAQYYTRMDYQKMLSNFDAGQKQDSLFPFQVIYDNDQYQQIEKKRLVQHFNQICLKLLKLKLQIGSQSLLNCLENSILPKKTTEQQIKYFLKDKLAKFLENKQLSLPESYRAKKLYQIRGKLRNMNFSQYQFQKIDKNRQNLQSRINQFEIARKQLQKQENELKKSIKEGENFIQPFILQFLKFLKQDNIKFQLSLQILKEEMNKKIFSQLKQLKNSIHLNQRAEIFNRQQRVIFSKTINIDNIIQQFSYFKLASIDPTFYTPNYYEKCMENSRPFCLIDKEKSSFGNELLKSFLQRLNQKINKQNVFIVSVIGSQESGKNRILSQLFPKSVHFKQDPLLKGVYMSVYQVNNKTIVVLDVLGIINITIPDLKYTSQQLKTQFAAFNHQSISLLIKESNLVIFLQNVKKNEQQSIQLFATPQICLSLGICLTILNAFTIRNSQKNIIPKNIILVFSDASDFQVQKKDIFDELITELSPILNKISMDQPRYNNIRSVFDKYVFLTQQDIIFLPHAEQQGNLLLKKTTGEGYGVHILALRNRVMKKINELQELGLSSRTILDFYQAAKVSWQTILLTTKYVVQTLSIRQLDQNISINYIYRQDYLEIYHKISTVIKERYINQSTTRYLQQIYNPDFLKPYPSIYQVYSKLLHQIVKKQIQYNQNGEDIQNIVFLIIHRRMNFSSKNSWFRSFIRKNVQILFNSILHHQIYYQYSILNKENVEKMTQIYLTRLIERIYQNNIKDKEFIQIIYQQKAKQFFDSLAMNRQGDQLKIYKQNTGIIRDFKIILLSQNIFQTLQIQDINDCSDFDENDSLKFINKLMDFQNAKEIPSVDQSKLIQLIQKKIQTFEQLIKVNKLGNIDQIINFIKKHIDPIIQQTNQDVIKQAQQIYSRIDNKKSNLEIQEKIQRKLLEVIQNMKNQQNNSSNQEIKKTYYENLFYRINNTQTGKILLNRINFKIILLGKLFRYLKNSIDRNEVEEIQEMRNRFNRDKENIKNRVQNEIEKIQEMRDKFNRERERERENIKK